MEKSKRHRRKTTLMLALAMVMLLAGAAAIVTPILAVSKEISLDAEEYGRLRQYAALSVAERAPNDQATLMPANAHPSEVTPFAAAPDVGRTGVDLAICKAENADFVAWLQIPGTTVDYPVVSTNDTKYYLNHAFSGKRSYLGTLLSLEKTDYEAPSQNIAIYGHHIRSNDSVMFSPLLAYKDAEFYIGHEMIYLDSLYHAGTYRIFAVVNMRSGDWEPSTASFASDGDFTAFVDHAKALSLYDTGVAVTADNEVLTLITCDRSYIPVEGRLVVMAVKQ